jgi:hypothetical protein
MIQVYIQVYGTGMILVAMTSINKFALCGNKGTATEILPKPDY